MKFKNKKICLLFSGGTVLNEKDIGGSTVNNEKDLTQWLGQLPEISIMAEIEPVFVCSEKEPLTGVKLWQKVVKLINEKYKQVDGFVILSKVEEVLNLGIALSFSLQNLNKPVILTGSQITAEVVKLSDWQEKKKKSYGGLGVKANLINSIQLVNLGLPAVALMFGNRIIRTVKAQRVQQLGLNLFESVDGRYLGKIDFGISLTEKVMPEESVIKFKNQFADNIQIIDYFRGIDFAKVVNQPKGLIVRNLPNLSELTIKNKQLPILVYNPFLVGTVNYSENIFMVNNLTWETAVIKFMWVLANYPDPLEAIGQEYCGEFLKH